MKKIICLLLTIIITLSIPIEAFAEFQDEDLLIESDYVDDYEEIADDDLANEIDYTCYEPITDPQLGENEEESIEEQSINNGMQPFSIVDTTENTDITLKLSQLSQNNVINQTDSSDLKLLINNSTV